MSEAAETVLITGGGSGIGKALAIAFHGRGAKVVIAGRNPEKLQSVANAHPGMKVELLDVSDVSSIAACRQRFEERFGALDLLINNAGVQQILDFSAAEAIDAARLAKEININLGGLIQVTNAFLPLLKRRPKARLVHVGSGLAYVPLAAAPIYSATKAGVHAFTIALRRQLTGGTVQVIEIIPPLVETDLHAGQARKPKGAMSIDRFAEAAMAGLDAGKDEIAIGLAKALRVGSRLSPGLFLNIVNKG